MGNDDKKNPMKPPRTQDPYVSRSDPSGDTMGAGGCMVGIFALLGGAAAVAAAIGAAKGWA